MQFSVSLYEKFTIYTLRSSPDVVPYDPAHHRSVSQTQIRMAQLGPTVGCRQGV